MSTVKNDSFTVGHHTRIGVKCVSKKHFEVGAGNVFMTHIVQCKNVIFIFTFPLSHALHS